MDFVALKGRQEINQNSKAEVLFIQFEKLLIELKKKPLPDSVIESVNEHIKDLNAAPANTNELKKIVKAKQTKIISLVEKNLKIVPINYYRNLWMVIGMSAFGLPIGVAIGLFAKNMGLLAIGLPIGMGIGIAVGSQMDKKAAEENRQLGIEIKH